MPNLRKELDKPKVRKEFYLGLIARRQFRSVTHLRQAIQRSETDRVGADW